MPNDNLAAILQQYGFSFVKLPRPNLEVLQLMAKDPEGYLMKIGNIQDLFLQRYMAYPSILEEMPVPQELSDNKSNKTEASVGIKLLSGILPQPASVATAFDSAASIAFSFKDATMDEVNLIQLNKFLNDADVDKNAGGYSDQVTNSEIYIITHVLKSKHFTVEALNSNGLSMDLEGPEIQDVLSANAKLKREKQSSAKMTYESEDPLVFGIKAARLIYNRGSWFWGREKAGFKIEAQPGAIVRSSEQIQVNLFVDENDDPFVDIKMPD
ncbi:MAG: hypothetical protein AAGG75_14550 [Bacteroidota bacterium]